MCQEDVWALLLACIYLFSCILMWYLIILFFLLFIRISLIAKNIWTLRRHSLGHWLIDVVKNVTKVSRNRYVFIWFQTFHNWGKLFSEGALYFVSYSRRPNRTRTKPVQSKSKNPFGDFICCEKCLKDVKKPLCLHLVPNFLQRVKMISEQKFIFLGILANMATSGNQYSCSLRR